MRSILILILFFQIGLPSRAQCPHFLNSDSTNRYYISIHPKHHKFDFVKHFGTSAFSSSLIDSSKFNTFDQIEDKDSLSSTIKRYTDGMDTLNRSRANSIPNGKWRLLSIRVSGSNCPATAPRTRFQDIYYFNLENNLFSSAQLKRSFNKKSDWHITIIGGKYLILSRGDEYIGNSSWRWGTGYIFRVKEE
ncbi:MAG: hypothetical protein AB8B56_08845 [Crocinitomicaceae bacterium]